jgi:hypothetical protein
MPRARMPDWCECRHYVEGRKIGSYGRHFDGPESFLRLDSCRLELSFGHTRAIWLKLTNGPHTVSHIPTFRRPHKHERSC